MAIVDLRMTIDILRMPSPAKILDLLRTYAHARLNSVFEAAREISIDDASKFIFFSDLHRGDNSRADSFARNQGLFHHALSHYYQAGFTYVEVGDGDELWKNRRFSDIVRAHPRIFELLHRFDHENRLHLLVGNHDILSRRRRPIEKDGIAAEEGLVLCHAETGQRLFVVHGHQADFKSDTLSIVARPAVRHVWRRAQLVRADGALKALGSAVLTPIATCTGWVKEKLQRGLADQISDSLKQTERWLVEWAEARRQMIICGHTHRPMFPSYDGAPYFNTGSCETPGVLTGLELQHGALTLVRWITQPAADNGGAPRVLRQVLSPSRKLRLFSRGL